MKERDIILKEYKILIEYIVRFIIVICCVHIIYNISKDSLLTFAIAIIMGIWVVWELVDRVYDFKMEMEKDKNERK